MSYSDKQTDAILATLEKNIAREYERAYVEMSAKANAYFDTLEERYQKEYEAYQKGKYTEAEFNSWYRTQVQRGEGYEKMRDDLANRMVSSNQVASAYINDKTPSIYSLNANYQAYEINKLTGANFQLVDEQTVKELMLDKNHTEFRTVSVNPIRDYEWNSRQIHSALTSGILQGKSIKDLSDSFLTVMKRNEASAVRNARTAVTSAQNAGRIRRLRECEDMGIEVEKEWLATNDKRTRDSHRMLDGQVRKVNEEFDNGLMYPADTDGAPEEVYNCRCTLVYVLPKYQTKKSNERYSEGREEGESYKEWLKRMQDEQNGKANSHQKETNGADAIDGLKAQLGDDFVKELKDRINKPAISEKADVINALFEKTGAELKVIDTKSSKSFFRNSDKGIYINAVNDAKGSHFEHPYEVTFHELSHNMDWLLNNKNPLFYLTSKEYNGTYLKDVIKSDYVAFKKSMGAKSNAELIRMLKAENKDYKTIGNVSDILEYCTNTSYPLGIGHGLSYHKGYGATEKEFMAEVVSSAIVNKGAYEEMHRIFPNAVDNLWNMIGGAIK